MPEETHDCNLELSVTGWNAGDIVAVEKVHTVNKVFIILTVLHFPRKTVLLIRELMSYTRSLFFPWFSDAQAKWIDFKLKTPVCLFHTIVCLAEKWYIRIHINLDSSAPGKETVYVTHRWKHGLLYSVPLGMFCMFCLSVLKVRDCSSCACPCSVCLWRQWHLQYLQSGILLLPQLLMIISFY